MFNILKAKRKRAEGDIEQPEKKRRLWLIILFLLLAALLGVSLLMNFYFVEKRPSPVEVKRQVAVAVQQALEAPREPVAATSEISHKWYGLCTKNSVHSIADFRRIVDEDPVLAKHFADFKWDQARMGRNEEAMTTFVTFRNNDVIRTGRKIVKLPAGDGYITDGERWVRTYCCNDYVKADAPDLNRLIERADDSDRPPPPQDPSEVPEAATFMYMSAGLGCLGLIGLFEIYKLKRGRRRVIRKRV